MATGNESRLRHRKEAKFEYSADDSEEKEGDECQTASTAVVPRSRSIRQFFREEWDTLAWIIGALIVTYITDFWFVLFQGEAVMRFWLHVGVGLFAGASVVMVILFYKHPKLHHTNWLEEAPVGVVTVTLLVGLACTSVTASLWPIWGIFTPSILFLLFMAFVSVLSLLS